jgi:DNA repair protein RecO (recombination protein O)
MTYKTKGIILRRINLGEADRILTILTQNYGKIRVTAKGIRKTLSKMAGHLEPFCLSQLDLAEGRNLDVICGAQILKCHINLRSNLEATQTAYYLAEIIDRMIPEKEKHPEVFELLDETLEHLNLGPGKLLISYFELNFLASTGFHPELEKCVHCGQKLIDQNKIDFESGGVKCAQCGPGRRISNEAIKVLRLFLKHRLSTIQRIKTNQKLIRELSEITSDYLTNINQKEFKSRRFV